MRVLAHIKKLDDCFGQFLVRVTCRCGVAHAITPEALARLVGRSITREAPSQRMRHLQFEEKAAEGVAVARPRPRVFRSIRRARVSRTVTCTTT